MSMTSGSSRELRTEINVTPLIDILLVLLIIFMVIQPTALQGISKFGFRGIWDLIALHASTAAPRVVTNGEESFMT
jgi:hypothetical protein